MALLLPLFIIALYVAMWIYRTDKTGECRWRQVSRDEAGRLWRCPVCGGEARTQDGEPRFCGKGRPRNGDDQA